MGRFPLSGIFIFVARAVRVGFSPPRASLFLVSFTLPSLQNHTYLLLSSLALALCCQSCCHILFKRMLSEPEEIVHSHPHLQVWFFSQADGLVRVSRCLSHAAGGFIPAGKWAASVPTAALPIISLQAWATDAALPPATPRGAAAGTWRRTCTVTFLSSWQAVGQHTIPPLSPYAGAPSLCVAMTQSLVCSRLPDAASPATQHSGERSLLFRSILYLSRLSGFASLLPVMRGSTLQAHLGGSCARRGRQLPQPSEEGLGQPCSWCRPKMVVWVTKTSTLLTA